MEWYMVLSGISLIAVAFIVGAGFFRKEKVAPPAPPAPPKSIKEMSREELMVLMDDLQENLARRSAAALELRNRTMGNLAIEENAGWEIREAEALERLRAQRMKGRMDRLGLVGTPTGGRGQASDPLVIRIEHVTVGPGSTLAGPHAPQQPRQPTNRVRLVRTPAEEAAFNEGIADKRGGKAARTRLGVDFGVDSAYTDGYNSTSPAAPGTGAAPAAGSPAGANNPANVII